MATFEEIIASASLPEATVSLCLNGALAEQVRQLERQLKDAPVPTSLGERSQAGIIAEQIDAVREQMKASEVDFRLRAMPGRPWQRLSNRQPVRSQAASDEEFSDRFYTWTVALVAATVAEPAMTPEQVEELVDHLPGASWDALSNACWAINAGRVMVPNSSAVSALTQISAPESRRLPAQESASPASTAPSRPKRPRTSTRKTAN